VGVPGFLLLLELPPQEAIHSADTLRSAINASIRIAFSERLRALKVRTIPISPGNSIAYKMLGPRSSGRSSLPVGAVVEMVKETDVALDVLLGLKLHRASLGRPAQL
jgi:hypothetical protein